MESGNIQLLNKMEIVPQLICECNHKMYKNIHTLKAHLKTQGHILWQQTKEQKDTIIKINQLEIEVSHLRRLNNLLLERLSQMNM